MCRCSQVFVSSADPCRRNYQHLLFLLQLPTCALRLGVLTQAKAYLSASHEYVSQDTYGAPLYYMCTHLMFLIPCIVHVWFATTSSESMVVSRNPLNDGSECPKPRYEI